MWWRLSERLNCPGTFSGRFKNTSDWTGNWQCNTIFWSTICHFVTAFLVPMNCTTLDAKCSWIELTRLNFSWPSRKMKKARNVFIKWVKHNCSTSISSSIQTGKENNGAITWIIHKPEFFHKHACISTHFHVCSVERCGKVNNRVTRWPRNNNMSWTFPKDKFSQFCIADRFYCLFNFSISPNILSIVSAHYHADYSICFFLYCYLKKTTNKQNRDSFCFLVWPLLTEA